MYYNCTHTNIHTQVIAQTYSNAIPIPLLKETCEYELPTKYKVLSILLCGVEMRGRHL